MRRMRSATSSTTMSTSRPKSPAPGDLAALAAIRELVRGLLDQTAGWTPDVLRSASRTSYRLDEERRLTAVGTGWTAFVGDLMIPLLEVVRLRDRLAICGNPVCRLVFVDGSRSGTRRWCDDAGCGNRDRAKRHRRQQGVRGQPAIRVGFR